MITRLISDIYKNFMAYAYYHYYGIYYIIIMNKENEIFLPGPEPFIFINNTECIICKKHFKSSCGLFRHKSIVRKYSEIPVDQEKIPNFLINKFKENIVYLIHRHLNKKIMVYNLFFWLVR